MKDLLSYFRFKNNENSEFFHKLKNKTGIRFQEYFNLKFKNNVSNLSLFGKHIIAPNAFWHLHSLNELFVDEVYKFKSSSDSPFIIDCGSNVGLSIIYFKTIYPKSRIIGFEPDPTIFKMLEHNINQFNFQDVQLFNKAVWVNEGEIVFNSTGALGGSLEFTDESIPKIESNNLKFIVQSDRLRNFLENKNVDFLKIDVEGAEFEIINDCLDVLNNVENLFIEYHRPKGSNLFVGDFIYKLESAGFRVYIKEAWNNLPHPFCFKDYNPMYDLQLNIFCFRY